MRPTLKLLSAATLAVTIAACGRSNDAAKPVAPPPKETVFDDLIATKARAKQQTDQAMQQNKEKMDAAMRKFEEGGATP